MSSRDRRHDEDAVCERPRRHAPARNAEAVSSTAARAVGRLQRAGSPAMTAADVVALQRTAGNHAVGRLMREAATEEKETLDSIPDSATPQESSSGATRSEAEEQPADGPGASPLSRQLQRAVLQRKESDTKKLCPKYWRYDTKRNPATYNCAGLAWRTYDFRGNIDDERRAAAAGGAKGKPGKVKHWFWEYDLHVETDDGRRSPESHDFHTVAGVIDKAGGDPDDVYSKNGPRPVYGPATGPSWKPAERDRATSNDPSETPAETGDGKPLFKVRSNFKESVTTHSCPK